ncbi:hypothetical protein ASC72_17065 [Flavobacterium sp. Root420]|nr:hypothetical protein ASC72_17065 [Flavobacterium sp. Root420]
MLYHRDTQRYAKIFFDLQGLIRPKKHNIDRNGKLAAKLFFENGIPSPDRSGNPFVAGFATKDWNG